MTPEQILERALNLTPRDRRIVRVAAEVKRNDPERWQAIALDVFGLRANQARLLLPEAVAVRAAIVNMRIAGQWSLDASGTHLISEA